MLPQAVLDALGGSVVAGELKGDLGAAEAAATAALDAARAGADAQARADAAIGASIVATLRLELSAAAARLEEAIAAVPDHPLGPAVGDFVMASRPPDAGRQPVPTAAGVEPVGWPWPAPDGQLASELFVQTWLPVRGSASRRSAAIARGARVRTPRRRRDLGRAAATRESPPPSVPQRGSPGPRRPAPRRRRRRVRGRRRRSRPR